MYYKEEFGEEYLCVFKKGSNDYESEEYVRKNEIDNKALMIVGTTGCLSEYTQIFTEKGICSLRELKNPFKVISYNFKKEKEEIALAKKINSGIQKTYKITTSSGKVVFATKGHIFFIKDKLNKIIEKKVADLKKGDKIIIR